MLYYPCIADGNGKIRKIVGKAMSRNNAETFLKQNYYKKWLDCQAIPQTIDISNLDKTELNFMRFSIDLETFNIKQSYL